MKQIDPNSESEELDERISETDRLLHSLAMKLRTQSPTQAEIDDALSRCRHLMRGGRKEPITRTPRVAVLHALLTPLCGTRAASHLLAVAGGHEPDWSGFVARLIPLVRCMCGETAAQLVVEVATL